MITGLGRRVAAHAAIFVALGASIVGLLLLGRGDLAAPRPTSIDALQVWLAARTPAVAVFALVRLVCLGLAGYLLAVYVLGLLGRVTRSRSVLRAADAAMPPGLRRATAALFGVGLVGAAAGPLGDHRAASTDTVVAIERLVPGGATEVLVPLDDDGTTDGEATLRLLPAVDDAAAAPSAPALEQWVVQRGDHLWSIAASHLSEVLGRGPTDAEITPYWRLVVEHNRPRLSNPSEPDMIFVGEVYELPPVPQIGA